MMSSNTVKQIIAFSQIITATMWSLQYDIQKEFNIETHQYGILYSVCNWSALIDVVHGYLLDRYLGIKLASALYAITLITGCVLFSIAAFTKSFWLFLMGRTIYGLGLNPLMLCTNKHIIRWFGKGKVINVVYSVNESVLWLGSSACFFTAINLFKFVKKYKTSSESLAITIATETMVGCTLTVVATFILASIYSSKNNDNESQKEISNKNENLTWRDYLYLSWLFWIFSLAVFLYFVSIMSFLSMSQGFFKHNYHLDTNTANYFTGLITFIGFFLSPVFGVFLDKFGQNLTSMTAAFVLNFVAHILLMWYKVYPLIPVVMMALSLVFSCSLWSQFQYLVDEHQYMIAYGVAQTGINFALAVGTLISGYLIDNYGYEGFMIYLLIMILVSLPLLVLIWVLNRKRGNVLNLNPKQKLEYLGRI